jgi:hypothetical protein
MLSGQVFFHTNKRTNLIKRDTLGIKQNVFK